MVQFASHHIISHELSERLLLLGVTVVLAVVAATMAVVVRSSQDPEHRRFSLGHLEARRRRAVVASLADAGREETIAAEPVDGELRMNSMNSPQNNA